MTNMINMTFGFCCCKLKRVKRLRFIWPLSPSLFPLACESKNGTNCEECLKNVSVSWDKSFHFSELALVSFHNLSRALASVEFPASYSFNPPHNCPPSVRTGVASFHTHTHTHAHTLTVTCYLQLAYNYSGPAGDLTRMRNKNKERVDQRFRGKRREGPDVSWLVIEELNDYSWVCCRWMSVLPLPAKQVWED